MIPIKLTIQGLYAYRTRQTIDFTELTHQHLFGIFGAVGSGKSSILDAITFALYGQIERVGKNDGLNHNIFNKASAEFLIDFEFESGKESNRYRFVVKNGRTKKQEPKSFERSAYEWKNEGWVPLPVNDASGIFNLSYDNFRRTIIIPQGRFSDFLQLTGSERTKMMLELFPRLEEFELSGKVSQLLGETNNALHVLTGQLQETGSLESMDPEEKKASLAQAEDELIGLKSELQSKESRLRSLDELKQLHEELATKKALVNQLLDSKSLFDQRKTELDQYERVFRLFDADLKMLDRSVSELKSAQSQRDKLSEAVLHIEEKYESGITELERTRSLALQIPELEAEIQGLKRVVEIQNLTSGSAKNRSELAVVEQSLTRIRENRQQNQEAIRNLKDQADSFIDAGERRVVLLEMAQIFKEIASLEDEVSRKDSQIRDSQLKMEKLKELKDATLTHAAIQQINGVSRETKLKDILLILDGIQSELKQQVSDGKAQLVDLATRQQLFEFSVRLKEGEPCPLCGSVHHPSVLSAEDVGHLERENKQIIFEKENRIKDLGVQTRQLEDIQNQLRSRLEEVARIKFEKQELLEKLDTLHRKKNSFPEPERTRDSILLEMEAIDLQQKNLVEVKKSLVACEKRQQELDLQMDQENQKKNNLEQDLARIEGQIQSLKKQDEQSGFSYAALTTDLQQRMVEAEQTIVRLKTELEEKTVASQKTEKERTELKARLQLVEEQLLMKSAEAEGFTSILNLRLEKEKLSEANVRSVLSSRLQVEEVRKDLDSYFLQLQEAQTLVASLEARRQNQVFDSELWLQSKTEVEEGRKRLADGEGKAAILKKEYEQLIVQMDKVRKLTEEKIRLEIRAGNLNTLAALFRGNAFVNYASSVYLKNVVQVANNRFFRLTRQKLRLVLDEENTFYVKDYMNDGHERLAKTLSGGQIFQASLSLALALADTVRELTKTDRNFFFLDEGFGSLDKESLALVFDTLRQLRHENRIVGVISHVEEMQNEIDQCLKIRMDEELGSVIEK